MRHVLHIGPDPRKIGGISSVIYSLCRLPIESFQIGHIVSWNGTRKKSVLLFARAVANLIHRTEKDKTICHVHFGNFGSYLREGLILLLSKFLGYKTVITYHGSKLSGRKEVKFWHFHLYVFPRLADVTISLSPETQDLVTKQARVSLLVANPLPPEILNLSRDISVKRNLVIFGGKRELRKGFQIFLKLAEDLSKHLPDWKFGVAGPEGDCLLPIPSLVEDYGELKKPDFMALLSTAKILCLPTSAEQSSMVIWEAIALDVIVITTRIVANENILGKDYPFYAEESNFGEVVLKVIRADTPLGNSMRNEILAPAQVVNQTQTWSRIYDQIFLLPS